MSIFERQLVEFKEELLGKGLWRSLKHPLLHDLSSNDALGLSRHGTLIERAHTYGERHGVGSGASRLLGGNLPIIEELEAAIAGFMGTEDALVFATGFQANSTIFDAIAKVAPFTLLADHSIHRSVIEGVRNRHIPLKRFRHNDMNHLEDLLKKTAGPALIAIESLYSMEGDFAPLSDVVALKERYGAALFVDEAHSIGVYGPAGRGMGYDFREAIDLRLITFGKAMGSAGASLGVSKIMKDHLINTCAGVIYTTAPPPPQIGAMGAAIELMPALGDRRRRLEILRRIVEAHGFKTSSHIIPLSMDSAEEALRVSGKLGRRGIYIPAIRPPTVRQSLLRLSLHTEIPEDILGQALNLVREAR